MQDYEKLGLFFLGRPAVLLIPWLTACTAQYTLQEFDTLARTSEAKTILLGEKASIYSPYDLVPTLEFANLLEEQRREVFALLEVEAETPILVYLHVNEGLGLDAEAHGDGILVQGIRMSPDGGFLGQAGGNVALIEVSPPQILKLEDGRSITQLLGAAMYRDTMRHEFTHLATILLGVGGPDWLREGSAHAVEWLPVADGRFVLEPVPEQLRRAAEASRGIEELDPLLTWRQSFPPAEQDVSMRMQAFTLVAFLLEKERATSLREGLLRIAAYRPEQVRRLQPEWKAWLELLASSKE